MKVKAISLITLVVFLICASIGIYVKKSYQKIDLNDACVAVFWESMLEESNVKYFQKTIVNSNHILCVEALEDLKPKSYYSSQKVKINKVFKSKDLKVGDEIEISSSSGATIYTANMVVDEDGYDPNAKKGFFEDYLKESEYEINIDFINKMTVGEKYLVFLDGEAAKDTKIYIPSHDIPFSPFFAYREINNQPANIDDDYSYKRLGHVIKYEKVKDNEFFGDTKKCIDSFNKLKNTLIKKYPEN